MDNEEKWMAIGLLTALFMVLATVGGCTARSHQLEADLIRAAIEHGRSPLEVRCAWSDTTSGICGIFAAEAQSEEK